MIELVYSSDTTCPVCNGAARMIDGPKCNHCHGHKLDWSEVIGGTRYKDEGEWINMTKFGDEKQRFINSLSGEVIEEEYEKEF